MTKKNKTQKTKAKDKVLSLKESMQKKANTEQLKMLGVFLGITAGFYFLFKPIFFAPVQNVKIEFTSVQVLETTQVHVKSFLSGPTKEKLEKVKNSIKVTDHEIKQHNKPEINNSWKSLRKAWYSQLILASKGQLNQTEINQNDPIVKRLSFQIKSHLLTNQAGVLDSQKFDMEKEIFYAGFMLFFGMFMTWMYFKFFHQMNGAKLNFSFLEKFKKKETATPSSISNFSQSISRLNKNLDKEYISTAGLVLTLKPKLKAINGEVASLENEIKALSRQHNSMANHLESAIDSIDPVAEESSIFDRYKNYRPDPLRKLKCFILNLSAMASRNNDRELIHLLNEILYSINDVQSLFPYGFGVTSKPLDTKTRKVMIQTQSLAQKRLALKQPYERLQKNLDDLIAAFQHISGINLENDSSKKEAA